ncbi:Vitamin B12 ABC transporter, B12-binding component BtuF [Methylophaga frappieri]|uniref:Vitamin B12 ABC transporter, B12-binding component BtuF n=1 Tax=Methylophaga frappieri (strain ATCC BAA-2434 / DSM 25690 / JAM7) TaxID=754477 RepID=I1YJE3_METFJ|nr:ABC transporter substrate-binding protein [Methylophaga frappieri]AFJ03036.1 Vitamin B12 ABC transporter, B12-binding component BtuF [Methylophaga frappieri]
MRALVGLLWLVTLTACSQIDPPERESWPEQTIGPQSPTANLDNACVADFDPNVDYFPNKTEFAYSTQLSVEYHQHYKRVRFKPNANTGEQIEFLLVQCGTPLPKQAKHVPVIQVPIQRLIAGNASVLGALAELDIVDRLYGTHNTRGVTVPAVQQRIKQGLVHDMWGYGHASIEQAMSVEADVYLSFYSAYPAGNMHPRLWELGVTAVPQADHHETHPLGRAEWIKLLALMTNRENNAEAIFNQRVERYHALQALVADVSNRPKVMAGYLSSRASFETFAQQNQKAQLIRDAGGEFIFAHQGAGSLIFLPFESVYAGAHQADVWLGTMTGQKDKNALISANPLHGWFQSVENDQVYAWDRDYTGAWASPFQDQSMTHPERQLAEVIAVLHPERLTLAEPEWQFLRQLP